MLDVPIGINLPDQEVTDPYDQSLENVIVTDSGETRIVRLRPGYRLAFDTTTAAKVDGIYDWSEHAIVIAVSNGNVYKLSSAEFDPTSISYLLLETGDKLLLESGDKLLIENEGGGITDVTGGTDMTVGNRVTWANNGDWLYMANGGKIQELRYATSYVTFGSPAHDYVCILNNTAVTSTLDPTNTTYWTDLGANPSSTYDAWVAGVRYGSGKAEVLTDSDAPTTVKQIAIADKYLLALEDGTQTVWFAEVAEPWSFAGEYFQPEHLPDDANVLVSNSGDIWVGGPRSIQIFQDDGVTPWISSNYGAISHGVLAPYSFVFCSTPGTFVWIDDKRRVVRLEGKTAVTLSYTLNTWLNRLEYVADAIADFLVYQGIPLYILQFPMEDKTVALNLESGVWSQWSTSTTRWAASCMSIIPHWDYILMGHISDGTINVVEPEQYLDGTTAITAKVRTPRLNADGVTRVPELISYLTKVVYTTDTDDATITVKHRDDDNTWTTERTVTLSGKDKTTHVKHLYRLGAYRFYRQYEFNLSDMWPYSLAKVVQK